VIGLLPIGEKGSMVKTKEAVIARITRNIIESINERKQDTDEPTLAALSCHSPCCDLAKCK